ncbi:DUF2291 domain-containing protein [Niabella hibiscisoli]|uniref:DUF2291 domain-containing protein n=1 Tax=Niabella hibiscisoli TaxID=1825928 RepID=UPI001F111F7E|nr:DUF2291 domain-containing protein [Niabella hibiscisoli]MCH5720224.1 DUF2291 domain-containing protein [Niabella hibiscisoli]
MNKFLKYAIILVAIVLLGYNSIYIKKLSDVKATTGEKFDAAVYVANLWKEKLPARMQTAVDINTLKTSIEKDGAGAFDKYTNALAIGNYRYALVKGTAKIDKVGVDDVAVMINGDAPFKASLLTEFVYGNALRDASGLVELKEFPNTSDLNSISEELNKMVRHKIVPSFKPGLKTGDSIEFIGAIELNKEHIHFDDIELIPLSVKIVH